jgi:hypothetical protein
MSAHTPGPWTLNISDKKWQNPYQVQAPSGLCIVSFDKEGLFREAAEANARLIAAAPELLEALADVLEIARQAIASGDWKVDGACDPDAAFLRAHTAIAKATQP